ncbi:hypothetical protein [Clostridium polyendosporum]|nr:hypothetical protein [Clostridium polyendosporum]
MSSWPTNRTGQNNPLIISTVLTVVLNFFAIEYKVSSRLTL